MLPPAELIQKKGIGLIYHFGSTALDLETKFSDLDLGIVVLKKDRLREPLKTYLDLYDFLSDYIKLASEIDLVLLEKTPFSFQYYAINEGKLLYEHSLEFRLSYEEYVLKMYLDYRFLEAEYSKAIREAFK